MKFPINTSTYSGFLWDFQGTFFLLNNDQRIYPPVSPAAYHEISWCIVLRQSCRASDWWRMWVKTKPHTHTTHDWEWRFIPPGDDWGLVYCLTHMISFEIRLQFGYKSIGLDETSWDGFLTPWSHRPERPAMALFGQEKNKPSKFTHDMID